MRKTPGILLPNTTLLAWLQTCWRELRAATGSRATTPALYFRRNPRPPANAGLRIFWRRCRFLFELHRAFGTRATVQVRLARPQDPRKDVVP